MTRSTVLIVALLVLLLAVAALGQSARLFDDAQAGERALIAARGASRAQIFALSAVQAGMVGILVAAIGPLLARAAYAGLAAQPAMVSAGISPDSGLPIIDWLYAGFVAVLFVGILLAPQLGHTRTLARRVNGKGRQRRVSALMRSGFDLGLVVLAAILYWQLIIYRGPVGDWAGLAIDPVLTAAPVVVLLASALVSVRLIPAAAHLVERLASDGKGIVLSLAAWEVGRRSRQVASAVLLLTLALGVGVFGQSFLATWQQSQVDQANFAVGAPTRVPVALSSISRQAVALDTGASGRVRPVIDRVVSVINGSGNDTGQTAVMLGLGGSARAMLDHGRLAQGGGDQISKNLSNAPQRTSGFSLPSGVTSISGLVRIGRPEVTVPGVSGNITAVLEDGNGVLSTFALGSVPLDGLSHDVRGVLPPAVSGVSGLRIVGLEADLVVGDSTAYGSGNAQTTVDILIGDLSATSQAKPGEAAGAGSSYALHDGASSRWSGASIGAASSRVTTSHVPAGWQLRMGIVVPALVDQHSPEFILIGWGPVKPIPAVITRGVAKSTGARVGDQLAFDVSGTQVVTTIAAIVPLVPGTGQLSQLSGSAFAEAGSWAGTAVVVDQTALERALIQGGASGPTVDEWWIDVPPEHAAAYLAAHPGTAAGARSGEVLATQLQQGPLRIATQAALWLAIIAAGILAAIGFAAHTAATMRARRLEFAQLRAIGLSRRAVVAVVGAESALLGIIGTLLGVGIGILLSWLVGPLVAFSPDGSPAVPAVEVNIPGASVAVLVLVVLSALACVVLVVAAVQRSTHPAQILRGADE